MGGEVQEEVMQGITAAIETNIERMHECSDRAAEAVDRRNWSLVIQGIVGVADEFRRVMRLCGDLSEEVRGEYVLRCGREHHSAKGKIAAALKKAFEEEK